VEVARGQTAVKDQSHAGAYFFFGTVALLCAAGDVRVLLRGGLSGTQRLVRHLWRICFGWFIATISFFLGQVLGKKHVSAWSITLPALVQKEQRYSTPEKMVKIIDAAGGQFKALFALQYAAGMRFEEVAGLHVEDLGFDNSVVHIRRSVYLHEETTPKTAAGYRDVDIHPGVMAMLKKHIGDRQTGLVFVGRTGNPMVVGNVNEYVLKPILKKVELLYGTRAIAS
jgi:integrase